MLPGLRVLFVFACAQATFGQIQRRVEDMQAVDNDNHGGDLDIVGDAVNVLAKASIEDHLLAGYTDLGSIVEPVGVHYRSLTGIHAHPADRDLQEDRNKTRRCVTVCLNATGCDAGTPDPFTLEAVALFFFPPGYTGTNVEDSIGVTPLETVTFVNGKATRTFDTEDIEFFGEEFVFTEEHVIQANSPFPCGDLSKIEVSEVKISLKDDPHMVGLLGQKIDWAGEDNMWYCILSDGPDFHINVRLSAPMREEFPDRQLVSAISLQTSEGHSLVIEVKDPYKVETEGCTTGWSQPCLADGGVHIFVDREVSTELQRPGDGVRLPGDMVVSAANLLPECRPFGGDRIWAKQFEQMTAGSRSLRGTTPKLSFNEWILEGDNLAAPTWCSKLLDEGGPAGLLSASSNHMIVRIETVSATIRVNVGVNYQDIETGPDGTVLVPDLEFWQVNLEFDALHYSDTVTGLLGDTSRFVLDGEGFPVTAGLGALHAPVENYRVDGPYGRVFDNMLR